MMSPNPSGHVVSKDGSRIAYDRAGQGPPVILVVGALCSRSLGPGVKLSPELARHFTVFTYDRRGRGESSEGSPYTVDREIEDLSALIEMAGRSVSVFGHSSGAVLALEAAERGLAIEKLALYEPPLILDRSRPSNESYWASIESAIAEGRRDEAVRCFMQSVGVPGFMIAALRWLPIWNKLTELAHTLPHDGAVVRALQKGEPLPAGAWSNVKAPVLAIVGGRSPAWMQHGVQALVATLPYAQHRVLDGQTHDVRATALAPVLDAFFGGPSAAHVPGAADSRRTASGTTIGRR